MKGLIIVEKQPIQLNCNPDEVKTVGRVARQLKRFTASSARIWLTGSVLSNQVTFLDHNS